MLLISTRLLCATAQKQIYTETEAKVSCAGAEFRAKGKTILEMGWKAVEAAFRDRLGGKGKKEETQPIPEAEQGQKIPLAGVRITEHETTPPKPFSDVIFCERKEWIGIEERSSA